MKIFSKPFKRKYTDPDPATQMNTDPYGFRSGNVVWINTVLRIRDVYPGSETFHPGPRIQGQKNSGSRIRIKGKASGMFNVHPGSGFFPIPDPEVKKAPDTRSGSATLG